MRYGVVDLTGRHSPSMLLLEPYYKWLQNDFYTQLNYRRHQLTDIEMDLIMGSVSISDIEDILDYILMKFLFYRDVMLVLTKKRY